MSSSDSSTENSSKSPVKTVPIIPGTYKCECGCGNLTEAAERELQARNARLAAKRSEENRNLWADHKRTP